MKARISQEPYCVLLWRFNAQSPCYTAVDRTAHYYKMKIRFVDETNLSMKVGDLCSGRATREGQPLPAPTELPTMIISGLRHDDGSLEGFIDSVKSGGAAFPIRAAVTPTSKGWTLEALLKELAREKEAELK